MQGGVSGAIKAKDFRSIDWFRGRITIRGKIVCPAITWRGDRAEKVFLLFQRSRVWSPTATLDHLQPPVTPVPGPLAASKGTCEV